MTMLDLEMNALEIARSVAGSGVNWLIQSSLLIIAGLWIGAALRSKGSAAQSAVYRTTLAAVLVCPLVSWGLAQFGATGWSLEMPAAYTQEEVHSQLPPDADTEPTFELEPVVATDTELPSFEALANTGELESSTPNEFPVNEPAVDLAPPAVTEEEVVAVASAVPAPTTTVNTNWFGFSAIVVGTTWLLLGGWLLARLAHSWRQLIRLRRTAIAADPATIETCRNVAELFRVDPPTVLHSPFLPSPCLAGLHRPAVLLPDDELTLPMRDVLIHELAHLARGDCYWNLLRRIGTSLLFFQPLMWLLSRRLDSTAEEVCDDYVVQFGGDRREYAHRLVDIAELSVAPVAAAGVGIVSLRSMLAARVARIMDTSRSLSTRVGHALLAIVLLCGLLGTILAGLVGVGPGNETVADDTATTTTEEAASENTPDVAADAPKDESELQTVRGRVVDHDGNPIASAHVTAAQVRWLDERYVVTERRQVNETHTAADGRFEVMVPKVEYPDFGKNRLVSFGWKPVTITATAPGHTAAWIGGDWYQGGVDPLAGEVTLQLKKESPTIRGRLVNLEGQPQAGLSVKVMSLGAAEPGKVDEWLVAVEQLRSEGKLPRPGAAYSYYGTAMVVSGTDDTIKVQRSAYFPAKWRMYPGDPNLPSPVRSDSEGRFELAGMPPDCLAVLQISGPGAATQSVSAVTRSMSMIDVLNTGFAGDDTHGYHGVEFDYAVAPGTAIFGTVTDTETGTPLSGMRVTANSISPNRMQISRAAWTARTDEDGRYRIDGLPIEGEKRVSVTPTPDQPYLSAEDVKVEDTNEVEPLEVNIKLRRGVVVRGKVTVAETGEPVDATLHYHPFLNNDFAKQYDRYDPRVYRYEGNDTRHRTSADGSFQTVVIPGRGILGVNAIAGGEFCTGLGGEGIETNEEGRFLTYNFAFPRLYQRVLKIDVPPDAREVEYNLTVSRGTSLKYAVHDPQGQPLTGVLASGVSSDIGPADTEPAPATVEFKSLRPGEKRRVILLHRERRLGRVFEIVAPTVTQTNAEPQSVTLLPCGIVEGRLINGEGEPVSGIGIAAYAMPLSEMANVPQQATTDANGAFRLEYLPIGAPYRIVGSGQEYGAVDLFDDLSIEPGEKIDAGTIDVTKKERPQPRRIIPPAASHTSTQNASEPASPEPTIVRGRVVGPDGDPVTGATVLAAWVFVRGYAPLEQFEQQLIAETKSDGDGNFQLQFAGEDREKKRRYYAWQIVAVAPGAGPAWLRDEDVKKESSVTLRLADDHSVRGKIVDLEGKPLAGVRVRVQELFPSVTNDAVVSWIEGAKKKTPPAALIDYFNASMSGADSRYPARFPTPILGRLAHGSPALPADVVTDHEGRFELNNLGANRLAILEVAEPSIAKSYLQVITRDMEAIAAKPIGMIGIRGGVYYGREFEFVAEPSQPIEGTVTDVDTGRPLAGIEIQLGQFAGNPGRQRDFLTTRTDEQGRYRLVGAPQGSGHRVDVLPDTDDPYFPTEKTLPPSSAALDPITCDFALKQGKWIVGKVTDGNNGAPVVDATVNFLPLRSNEHARDYPNYRPEITGSVPNERIRTAEDGSFRILAIPGNGILVAIAPDADRQTYATVGVEQVPKHLVGEGSRLNTYHPWEITGYHSLREVEVDASANEVEYDLQLTRGRTRVVKLLDTSGKPVSGVRVLGRTMSTILEEPAKDSTIEIIGLRPNQNRPVAFIHAEQKIGSALLISPGDELTLKLEPCAVARGRFVDKDGEPVRDVEVRVDIAHTDSWGRSLAGPSTDADGRFEVLLSPGLSYYVAHYTRNDQGFSAECKATSGAIIELGDLVVGTKLTVEQTANLTRANESNTPSPTTKSATSSAGKTTASRISGRVLDQEGKPITGATVRLPDDVSAAEQSIPTDANGNFQIEFDKTKFTKPEWHQQPWQLARLIAAADGFAPAWVEGRKLDSKTTLTITLKPDDVPVRGQILTLEGQPVPNARLEIWDVYEPSSGNLDGLLKTIRDDPDTFQPYMNREMQYLTGRLVDPHVSQGTLSRAASGNPIIVTDEQGQFEFRGIGRERMMRLSLTGSTIQSTQINVVTRPEIDAQWERMSIDEQSRMMLNSGSAWPQLYAATLKHLAGPSAAIRGIVRNKETGKPLSGIPVGGWLRNTDNHAHATTDVNGRYELTGLGIEGTFQQLYAGPKENEIEKLPYLGAEKNGVSFSPSSPLSEEDTTFELSRGIVVRGKVTDAATNEPVKARVEYMGTNDNPFTSTLADDLWPYGDPITNDEGEFAIVVPPGPGALAVWTTLTSDLPDRYRPVDPKAFGLPIDDRGWIATVNRGLVHPWSYKAARHIDLKAGEAPSAMKLVVERITDFARVRCVDENGRTLDDIRVQGHLPWRSSFASIAPRSDLAMDSGDGAYIEVAELGAESRKPVVFSTRERDKAAILFPSRSKLQPRLSDLKVAGDGVHLLPLAPAASIRGRLVDADGNPVRSAGVELVIVPDENVTTAQMEIEDAATDQQGQFELRGLPAGGPFWLACGNQSAGGILKRNIQLTAGQQLDLGDVDITKGQQAEPNRAPAPLQTNANEKSNASAKIANESLRYAGQVVDAQGQPIEGAKIYLAYWYSNQDSPPDGRPLATTAADGKFQFSMSRRDFRQTGDSVPPWLWGSIVAVAEGHGVAWGQSLAFETTGSALAEAIERAQQQGRSVDEVQSRVDAERGPLRLARDDLSVDGRVVDINGLPIAGAKVKVVELRTGKDNTLDAWEEASRRPGINLYEASQAAEKHLYGPFVAEILPQTLSDDDGRFTLRGLGRDRLVRMVVEAEGFETNEVYSRLRPAEAVALADQLTGTVQVYGPRFTHVAAPSRPVEGIVRDAKTHQPVAGVRVTSRRSGFATTDRQIQRAGSDFVRAVTNEAGRFRLAGLPNSPQNPLIFQPASGQPYLTTSMRADTRGADSSLVTLNVELTPAGGIVIGRVVDQDTGEGVSGQIKYLAVSKNDSRPGAASTAHVTEDIRSDMEGHFRFVAPAGPAYLAFSAFDESYRLKDSQPEGATEMAEYALFMARGNGPQYHALAKIDLDGKRKEYPVELKVERSNIITGQLLDPNGQPLSAEGGSYIGRVDLARWQSLKGGKFSVLNFDAARPRQLVFVVPDRQLAGELLLKEKPQGPLTVRLQPWATVTGRIVEDDGVAIQDLALVAGPLEATILPQPGEEVTLPQPRLPLPPSADGWSPIKTDSDGRFVIAGLLPGIAYDLSGIRHTNPFDSLSGDISQGLKISPGETRDLGAIELKPVSLTELLQRRQEAINRSQEPEQKRRTESEPDKSETSEKSVHIRGRVVGPNGQPAAGAHVAVIGASNRERRGGDLDFRDDVLAETTTTADGNYNLALKGISSKTHTRTSIVARAEGLGLAWRRLDPDARTVEASFELAAEQKIRGRLVDIEGQPADGVRMTIAAIMPTATDGKFTNGVGYHNFAAAPAGWPQPAPTDVDGRFVLHGIPAGHGVFIEVAGSERFAPQQISLNTGMPEQRGERDGTYRSLVKNIKAGEEAVLALAPAQIFEGVVRYEDTGEVAPHARLTIWASQQKYGSMHSVPGKADAQGRYRISPTPGIRFGVTAYPPDGAPYLTRRLPEIDWDDAAKIKQLDVTLPRGVLVRGKVVEAEGGVPIACATVQYEPEETNNPNYADDILTGWQGIQITNDRGEFKIVVLPGPGHLLVHGTQDEFVIRETSSLQLMRGRSGGARYYANAIERLNPVKGADPVEVTIKLERGAKIAGQLVNEAGAPVDEALMITRLNIVPTTLSWRGDASKHVLGGRFDLSPLEPGVKYTVHFLDAKQRLGATVTLSTDDATPTVVLKPCGQAVARFVDEDGEPMADIRPGLHMVVTPGVNELDFEARKRGELAADTDFLANIDRVNHWDRPPTDKDGRTTYPALIPGATYRILQSVKGEPHIAREFTVESHRLLELGEIVLERKD